MKIKSRFTDGYDFDLSVDRNDTVMYHREFKITKENAIRNRFKSEIFGLYVKLGNSILHFKFNRKNSEITKSTYLNHRLFHYNETLKKVEVYDHARLVDLNPLAFVVGPQFPHRYISSICGSDYNGQIFVNDGMIEFLENAEYSKDERDEIKKSFSGEVGLMYVDSHSKTVVNDFSLIASGLISTFRLLFGDNLSAVIDGSLSTRNDCEKELEISNKNKLERHGFDNKDSFRNRKQKCRTKQRNPV